MNDNVAKDSIESIAEKNIVLWGRGNRGEDALFLTRKLNANVVAVIDSNADYWGTYWHGIPIINFEEYLSKYNEYIILITTKNNIEIEKILDNNKIDSYFKLNEICNLIYDFNSIKTNKNFQFNMLIDLLCELFANKIYCGYSDGTNIDLLKELKKKKYIATACDSYEINESFINANLKIFLQRYGDINTNVDAILIQGIPLDYFNSRLLIYGIERDIPIYFQEESFICTIEPFIHRGKIIQYTLPHSFVLDKGGLYYKADAPSYLETLLELGRLLTYDEMSRTKSIIKKVISNKISKYNHQPIFNPDIGNEGKQKILIIDQVDGDKSITYGLADSNTFLEMYDAAIKENPDADIIIKSHPDKIRGHYGNIELASNVYLMDEPINPISLLEYVDKVYVCTSQMGFEALMCGKEVHVFGMPFYAGWGVTHDRLKCERRTRKRSVEEIFYFAYIEYSHYISYETNSECEIEQCIDELLQLRQEYFKEMNRTNSENEYICTPPMD